MQFLVYQSPKRNKKKYYKLPIGVVMRYIKSFADVNDEWKWLGEKKALFCVLFCYILWKTSSKGD